MSTTAIDTSWETLTDYGRSLLDAQDRQRWQLGELVDLVQTHYGESSITKFCEEVKGKPSTLYQYAQVYRFYPRDSWKEYPLVRYTQWREAMKLKDVNAALALIQRANDENMRMQDFFAAVKAAGENSTAYKIFDRVLPLVKNGDYISFECDAAVTPGALYRVVIKEV